MARPSVSGTCEYCGQPVPDWRLQVVGCCIPGFYRLAKIRIGNGLMARLFGPKVSRTLEEIDRLAGEEEAP